MKRWTTKLLLTSAHDAALRPPYMTELKSRLPGPRPKNWTNKGKYATFLGRY